MTASFLEPPAWRRAGEAPAKINLALQVLRRTPDGFHDIRTVMARLEMCDTLEIEARWEKVRPADAPVLDLVMTGETSGVVGDERNLVLRAARLLLARCLERLFATSYVGPVGLTATGPSPLLPDRLRFALSKCVPAEGGLGGGSSDAAATLRLLNHLPGAGLQADELHALAATLGSDVPYALEGGTTLAEGRGERLARLAPLPPWHVVLVRPPLGISTAWCYREWDELAATPENVAERSRRFDRLLEAVGSGDLEGISELMFNDLQEPVLRAHPALAALPGLMKAAGCTAAAMTGSGSCFFGLTPSEALAQRAAEDLRQRGFGQVWCTRLRMDAGPDKEA